MAPNDAAEANIVHWEKIFASRAWGKYPPEDLIRFVARTFPDLAKRRHMQALEIGCGTGANLWYLAREGFAIAGIDGSKTAIGAASERIRSENLYDEGRPPDIKVGNFAKLPWPDACFDLVVDIEALSANITTVIHSAIKEAHRVLKPGGWFFSRAFGPGTTGTDTGKMLEEGTTENPASGPLSGMGIIHTFTEPEIRREFGIFSELRLDWDRRSDKNQTCEFFEWIVQARK
ncbi:MAG TPA: class I SAM-dependent methyltransferase [Pseudolabrys sp.]|nr:class I SAM-dependent methyltransferase [Pseudolabrys sp.]